MTKALRSVCPVTLLAALPLILYAPFLFGGKVLYWGVYLLQFYPWRQLAVEQIRAGHWPLWNPYLGAGTPLAANLQTATFYPPNVLFLLMPVEQAFGWEQALHVALASLFTYYLGRTLSLGRFGALIAGLAYGMGGYLVARWVFPTMVNAAAWLPLMLAMAEKLLTRDRETGLGDTARHTALLALVVALQLLAGHAQTSFYSLLILAAFGLCRAIQRARGATALDALRLALPVALASVWAVALAAIQLLPTAEFTAHSQRAGTLEDLTFAYELSFWPWRLITLLAPDFFGNPARAGYWGYGAYWEEAAYIGILPLILALLAGITWWRKRRRGAEGPLALVPFLLVLCLVSLVLALGRHTPLYPLVFRYVPGFGLFQAPARLIIGYALAVPLLAGIGADALAMTHRLCTWLRLGIIAGLGMALAGALARLALPAIQPSFGLSVLRLGLTLALSAGLLMLHGRRVRGPRWEGLAVALLAADLLAFGWGLAPGTDPSVYSAPVASAEFLQAQPPGRLLVAPEYAQRVYDEYVSLEGFGPGDPAYLQGLRESQHPNLSAVHEVPTVGNYDPLIIGLYRDLCDLLEEHWEGPATMAQGRPILDLLAARYVLSDEPLNLPLVYDSEPRAYANETALPEAYVVHQARVIEDPRARMAALLDPAFEPRREVLLSVAPTQPTELSQAQLTKATHGNLPCHCEERQRRSNLLLANWGLLRSARNDMSKHPGLAKQLCSNAPPSILRDGPNRVIIRTDVAQPGYLVLADAFYPGWWATVDGEAAEILPANHAFRAVALDRGQHTVVFQYEPLSFRLGAWITLASVVLLVVIPISGEFSDRIRKK